jgi:hypothetical protein
VYWVLAFGSLAATATLVAEFFARRRPLFSPRFWISGATALALLALMAWAFGQVAD